MNVMHCDAAKGWPVGLSVSIHIPLAVSRGHRHKAAGIYYDAMTAAFGKARRDEKVSFQISTFERAGISTMGRSFNQNTEAVYSTVCLIVLLLPNRLNKFESVNSFIFHCVIRDQ